MNLMTETCILRYRGKPIPDEYDDYGNPVIGPSRDETWPCWYEPRGSTEDTAAKDQQIHGYWVYLPLSIPLAGVDVVILEGDAYQVIGEPGRQPGGFIVSGFVKAAIERVTG
ncbi:hypothetical protein [Arthrobacter rhombi]|uniref:hypothetical protein n=1 Tax=Arthrobacter rhombi TaxID=71253 RepID=UPI003FD0EB02